MRRYLDPKVSFAELKDAGVGPVEDMARFKARDARRRLLLNEPYMDDALRQLVVYPFEVQWAYYTAVRQIWNEPRPELVARAFHGNGVVVTRLRSRRSE